jgi:hypothetical protein
MVTLLPPSTANVCAVIKDASSEAKKAIVLATSSTLPCLPIGCVFLQFCMKLLTAFSLMPVLAKISVSITPYVNVQLYVPHPLN